MLALAEPQPFFDTLWFPLSRVLQMVSSDLFDLRVSGLEKLPKNGPYILSSNHQSYIDPIVLASVLPREIVANIFDVGTSEV